MSVPKRCVTCGAATTAGRRCPTCEVMHQHRRNAQPRRRAYADPVYRAIPLGGRCWVCGQMGADTRDHVVPLAMGGSNEPSNVRPAHRACNSGRG